jgi:hypothetical protein
MLAKVNKFLTPNKRKAVYGVVAALIAALIAFDVISPTDLSDSLSAIVMVLSGLASVMAFVNVSPGPADK